MPGPNLSYKRLVDLCHNSGQTYQFVLGKALLHHPNLHQALKRNKLNQGNGSTLRQLPGQRALPKEVQDSG